MTDPNIGKLNLAPHFQIIGESDFTIPDEWREWLGSIRVEEVEACDLFIAAKVRSTTPDVLDGENILLSNRVRGFYRGLLLSSTFATAHKPVVLTESCRNGVVGLRQQQDLDAPVPNDFRPYPDVPAEAFRQAAQIAECLEWMSASRQGGNRWRFHRALHLYSETRAEQEILERIHQYTRCIDGFVTTGPGEGRKHFKSRTELFIGPRHHELMGEIYDVRSSVEQLSWLVDSCIPIGGFLHYPSLAVPAASSSINVARAVCGNVNQGVGSVIAAQMAVDTPSEAGPASGDIAVGFGRAEARCRPQQYTFRRKSRKLTPPTGAPNQAPDTFFNI